MGWTLLAAGMLALVGGFVWVIGGDSPENRGRWKADHGEDLTLPDGKHQDRESIGGRRDRVLVSWRRLQGNLAEVYPGAVREIGPGTGPEEAGIREVERELGMRLPGEYREFLKLWRGDVVEPGEVFQDRWEPFYEGCDLIELRRMVELTKMMTDVADDQMTEAEKQAFLKREPRVGDFWHPRLVQVTNSHGGGELGIDCHTGEVWSYCGANYQLEGIVAPSWKGLLDAMNTALEEKRYELDQLLFYKLPLWDETGVPIR